MTFSTILWCIGRILALWECKGVSAFWRSGSLKIINMIKLMRNIILIFFQELPRECCSLEKFVCDSASGPLSSAGPSSLKETMYYSLCLTAWKCSFPIQCHIKLGMKCFYPIGHVRYPVGFEPYSY